MIMIENIIGILQINEKELQIPDTTLRRYIHQHGHHLNIKKNGKSYLVANESIPLLKKFVVYT
ncbi:hypothetical protein BPUM_04370 [Bacillus pumilus SAFR-032]|uniref:DNA-binding protein n=1 Tax=Bacillus pumilus (strain SAFR-032) TaxID=315750 RepID=A0A0U2X6B6_BACP2|nr:hypothetical protein BPUM_04370 [Bacillus pumilus SAFR-032]